ncbi:FAD-dependent oxidoreductase [Paenibacillus sp.]|uniref:FAD-dependent oxidoreductase n=1 Tax=Paenibacillus sp. TaxID=58172 RepID=UPI002D4EB6FC|nr:FAD-dependent monooxygenase [Paenibacillus sp.]HZG56810.1 FAD-dependent monooxygenase [Paenibacillus sp.]
MKILIVGGGIAGLSLAGLLTKRGVEPVVVEKTAQYGKAGYFLGLWPIGSRVLHALGVYDQYVEAGYPISKYKVYSENGRVLKDIEFGNISKQFGESHLIARYKLLEILRNGLGGLPIRMGTSVDDIRQDGRKALVTFTDGRQETFDLVVGADGIHSRVRSLVFGELPLRRTGWGGWGFWVGKEHLSCRADAAEIWGRGKFLGIGATQQGYSGTAIVPIPERLPQSREETLSLIRSRFHSMGGTLVPSVLRALDYATDVNFLELSDFSTERWADGRVVLIGDAAAGFLPTAGIGASMALESAAVLNDELSRASVKTVEQAIALFVKRRKNRIDSIQRNSRNLARIMFTKSVVVSGVRDLTMRLASEKMLFKEIAEHMLVPI